MDKKEHIAYWLKMAQRDWESVLILQKSQQNVQSLFFAHLVIEKMLKAHFVKDNIENTPPFTHNLETLYNQSNLDLEGNFFDLLGTMNGWNIEGRYQDYKDKFYKMCTNVYVETKLLGVNELKECLAQNLL
jgi:HEPN domain-containing protein